MGMLIRRHRDRHSEDATPRPRRARKRKTKVPAQVEGPKAPDAEADKPAGTEPDPGAGGNQVGAPTVHKIEQATSASE